MNATEIKAGNRTYEQAGALTFSDTVKSASGTLTSLKAGHLIVHINGAWYAYAKTTDPLTQTVTASSVTYKPDAVGILMEDVASLDTTGASKTILYAGKVWHQFIIDAGIAATTTAFKDLICAPGKIVFANEG